MTVYFVEHFLNRAHDRTAGQMQQAARSGKQNIVEGYSDAEGSTSTEHRLTVIAKGSLEELKEDFRDYLQVHSLQIWDANHEKYIVCQQYFRQHNDAAWYMRQIAGRSAEDICNMTLIVIFHALALIRGLIDYQNRRFLREGGVREQRYQARLEYRNKVKKDGRESRDGRCGRESRYSRYSRCGRGSRENTLTAPTSPTIPTSPTTPTIPTSPTPPTPPTSPTSPTTLTIPTPPLPSPKPIP